VTRPRVSLAGLLLAVAVVALHCAVLLGNREVVGLPYCLDTGLLPVATALAVVLFAARRRGRPWSPFAVGFLASGTLAALGYVACCRAAPGLMGRPVIYYVNEIEPRFTDADTPGLYALSLWVRGLMMGLPLCLVALLGGLAAAASPGRDRRARGLG
jgi:hypothetical protein